MSFSVGTKLLISVLVLLAAIIAFLDISAIFLLREDKRAYIYQAQSTEAMLAGREFVNTARHEIDTLRIALGSLDPRKPLTRPQADALQSLVDNQSDLVGLSLGLLDPSTGAITPSAHAARAKEMKALQLTEADFTVGAERIRAAMPELKRASYAFINLSRADGIPALGILVADLADGERYGSLPVAFGLASLKGFGSELGQSGLTIASKSGRVLFDTDPAALFSGRSLKGDPLFEAAVASKVATGAQEYEADDKHYLGSYVQPGLDLVVFTKTDWKKAIRATYELIVKLGLLGAMAIGVGLVFAIVFSKTLTRPVNRLYQATKQIAQGDFNLDMKVLSRDEIGALTDSFNMMSKRISELMKEQAHKIHLENELAIASTVQQTLIPPPMFKNSDVLLHSHYQAASECGGDWWGFFGVGRKFCVMIADATGHGMPSALITASARSCVSCLQKLAQEDPDFSFSPAAMLSYANRVVYEASLGSIMMTFFVAVIDFDEMKLSYSNAGHNPPWLFSKQGGFRLQSLTAVGQRLGEARDAPPFEEKTVDLSDGDLLFMYTDGLTEGKDPSGEMFGKKRVRKLVEGALAAGPEAVTQALMEEFMRHNGEKALDDDVTIAVARILDNPLHGAGRGQGSSDGYEAAEAGEGFAVAEASPAGPPSVPVPPPSPYGRRG